MYLPRAYESRFVSSLAHSPFGLNYTLKILNNEQFIPQETQFSEWLSF